MKGQPYTVALDFDGTIYGGTFTAPDEVEGPPVAGAIEWVRSELARGHRIIIHTCRLTPTYPGCPFPDDGHRDQLTVQRAICAWFAQHGLTYEEAMRLVFWTHRGKPWANEYLDDKGLRFVGGFPEREPVASDQVFVVTEANGAMAVAEVFASWTLALYYAQERFRNYSQCADRSSEINPGAQYATFSASWDPGTDKPDVMRRVDISVWARKVRTEALR